MKRKFIFAVVVAIVAVNWTWGRLPSEPPAPAGSKYAMTEGVNFNYVETPGREPAVVMIHGHPGTYLDWAYVQQKLSGRRTIAIDRPGYGYSSGGYIDFNDQVSAIHALTKKLKLDRPVIAGHSYGGALAIAYAQKYPRETKAIVAVDPGVEPNGGSAFDKLQAQFVKVMQLPVIQPLAYATFSQAVLSASADPQVKKAFEPDPINPDYEKQLKAVSLKSSDLKTFADEELDYGGVVDQLAAKYSATRTPAWVIQGTDDQLVPTSAVEQMAGQLPNAKYIPLSGGHMQTWVHPTQVARAINSAAR
ncbi:MAG: alpha/beta hydrolase [Solirubrobacterales bacterium]|nr:alpha/beta hydrolase [Solirubrobacterales bacterium]